MGSEMCIRDSRPAIQMEGDWGSKNEDGCIPVLDLKMKTVLICEMEDKERGMQAFSYYQTSFKFFKKPMARPTIMDAKTAMPAKMKRETTSNELLRRLLNTSPSLPNSEEDMVEALNIYMVEMRNSGYDERYRKDTLVNTVKGYRRKVVEAANGGRPLYREAHEGARERYLSKISAASKWFKKERKGDHSIIGRVGQTGRPGRNPWRKQNTEGIEDTRPVEGVIFVPHTQDSALQRRLQKADDQVTKALGMLRTRYMEGSGTSLKDLLVRKNPWFKLGGGCGRQGCHICLSQQGKGTSCRKEGACYQIVCSICEKKYEEVKGEGGVRKTWYVGETSRSPHERLKEHMWLFRNRKEGDPEKNEASSALWRHSRDNHDGRMREEDWCSKVTSSHMKALNRQVTEAVRIAWKNKEVDLLNSKHEFGANLLMEVVIMRGDHVLGARKPKRKRNLVEELPHVGREEEDKDRGGGSATTTGGEEDNVGGVVEEEENTVNPPGKKRRTLEEYYGGLKKDELMEEAKRRRLKVKGRMKDEIVLLLLEEDRTQPKIGWGNHREEGEPIISNSRALAYTHLTLPTTPYV